MFRERSGIVMKCVSQHSLMSLTCNKTSANTTLQTTTPTTSLFAWRKVWRVTTQTSDVTNASASGTAVHAAIISTLMSGHFATKLKELVASDVIRVRTAMGVMAWEREVAFDWENLKMKLMHINNRINLVNDEVF